MSCFREIRWEEWSEDHIAQHGVTPEEVEQALLSRPQWVTKGRNDTTCVYGTTDAGRHLMIVVSDEGRGVAFIVTARNMTDNERKTFRRKAR
jgi:uncharacterized DUF497 family protein